MTRELVVVSGKGGTGKTSLTASFAVLSAGQAVVADCDVDAPDLHVVLAPRVRERHEFRCGNEAVIRQEDCIACGACLARCRFDAVRMDGTAAGDAVFTVDPVACEGCGVCVHVCPVKAIDFPERVSGEWMVSDTRSGTLVHARLQPGGENSGKLVSTVRREARRLAEEEGKALVIADGPPGIGCPVIASVTGASVVLAVTEPTLSGEHDLWRVLALAAHFNLPVAVCVNKWDINPGICEQIEARVRAGGGRVVGRVPYDRTVTAAMVAGKAVVELDGPAARAVREAWGTVREMLT